MWTYGTIWGNYGDEKKTSTTATAKVGDRLILPDGRVFYYGFADGAVGKGSIIQAPVAAGNHDSDLPVAISAAVGAKVVNVTLGATAAALDLYAGGYLFVGDSGTSGTGEGHMYRIDGHAAIDSSGDGDIRLMDSDPLVAALVAGQDQVGLLKNPYQDFVIMPVTMTNNPVGVLPVSVANNAYVWAQTWGPAAVLCDVAFTIGQPVRIADGSTPGAGEPYASNTSGEEAVIGIAMHVVPATTEYGMVDLRIRP